MELADGEVHVWTHDLDDESPSDRDVLDGHEQQRALGFRMATDRKRWIAGRTGLRRVLGAYLDTDPGSVVFRYGRAGKPELAGPGQGLVFNRSAAAGRGVIAVGRRGRIGIDLESLAAPVEDRDFLEGLFAPGEIEWIYRQDQAERRRSFLTIWTAKEAVVKAHGAGLGVDLRSFELAPAPVLRLLSAPASTAPGEWFLASVDVGPGWICTLATEGVSTRPLVRVRELR